MNYKITRILSTLIFVALLIALPSAQKSSATTEQPSADRVALYQALLDMQNPWTVMCVAAHPDDEDGTSLIVMRHKYGAHTVSLFSTFGEGGQNAIGPELYEELGAIRAHETMAAAEIQGSEPHFLGLKDFGFSKTRDEAFRFWGHEEALRRMVLEIRKLRPDVIITNHSTTSNDHGQHQATALMVVEAFDAAADPTKFPEQLKGGVTTWQVQRLFVRARGQNPNSQGASELVTIDPNEKDPVRGVVYAEEALRALQQHATQGPWPKTFADYIARFRAFTGQGGASGQMPFIRYALVRQAKGADALPLDSHNFLDGLKLPAQVATESGVPTLLHSLLDLSANREQAFAELIEGFRRSNYGHPVARPVDPERRERMKERVEQALALAAGIDVKVQPSDTTVVPDSTISLSIKDASGKSANLRDCTSWLASQPEGTSTMDKVHIPANAPINVPLSRHLYEANALGLEVDTRCTVEVSGARFDVERAVKVEVAPPIEITAVGPRPIVTTSSGKTASDKENCGIRPVDLKVRVTNHQERAFSGAVNLFATNGGPVTGRGIAARDLNIPAGQSVDQMFTISGCQLSSQTGGAMRELVLTLNSAKSNTMPALEVPVVVANANVAQNLRVGYVRGFDFSLPNALNALGVESKELSVDDVKTGDLSQFSSVIVDNRVYELKPELIAVNQKLLDYAQGGGTLIVFYHKNDEWNPDERRNRPQLAPYKLLLGGERVTDENAPITFLEADHPLLNSPNKLNQDDFKGWIQERGLYYPKEWDPQFHALLESNDPGEAPLKGGLLVANYGKGHYIYTSMVWYRELRGGIPGAYRMLANMISYGRT
jgi:LmbE family N-acetylglucosaminyl deacetylase